MELQAFVGGKGSRSDQRHAETHTGINRDLQLQSQHGRAVDMCHTHTCHACTLDTGSMWLAHTGGPGGCSAVWVLFGEGFFLSDKDGFDGMGTGRGAREPLTPLS